MTAVPARPDQRADREVKPTGLEEAKPTGLKGVIDQVPDRCYQRSTIRGLGLLLRDFALYGLAMVGLFATNNPILLVPLWLVAGVAVSGLFVLGHDAAHGSLFDSRRLNRLVGRVAMLPGLHATEIWIYGHNRVHHGHTLRQGFDVVWHPLTIDEFETLNRFQKARHRLEWGPFGAGAYYMREIWWNKMMRMTPPHRWARAMRIDQLIVASFLVGAMGIALWNAGLVGFWVWFKLIVVPFVVFSYGIGFSVYMHHIHPSIRWWTKADWNRFRGQVEGTTIFWLPWGWDFFFHWIMVHLPHHVDMRIPCYRLTEAAKAIAEAFPDDVEERRLSVREYVEITRQCKLHDFDTGEWHPYPPER